MLSMTKHGALFVLLAGLLAPALCSICHAQLLTQTVWENLAPLSPDASVGAYLRILPHQSRYLTGGCESVGNGVLYWPAYVGAYASGGQPAWQHRASNMTTCEQALLPWGAGTVMLGNINAPSPPGRSYDFVPFLEWFSAAGTSVRRRVLPPTQVQTTACAALAEADGGYTFTGFGYDPAGPPQTDPTFYTLTRTDSLGAVLWSRVLAYPVLAHPYPNDLLRTARGGYLLTGFAGYVLPSVPDGYTDQPWLVETDAAGNFRRQATLPVFAPEAKAQVNRGFNNTLPLAGGATYALAGVADSGYSTAGRAWGYVACFDTALQLQWTTRLPARRGQAQRPTRVRQLPSGALQVLSSSYRQLPYLFLTTLNPTTGAIVREEEFQLAGLASAGVWDWQALADSSLVVAGSAARFTASGGTGPSRAWLGRYKRVSRLVTAAGAARAGGPLGGCPDPAGPGEAVRAARPAGAGAGQLVVHDALGRRVRTAPVPATGGPEVALPVAGLAPGWYWVEFRPDQPNQPRHAARLLLH